MVRVGVETTTSG